jgi:hypothetical protein
MAIMVFVSLFMKGGAQKWMSVAGFAFMAMMSGYAIYDDRFVQAAIEAGAVGAPVVLLVASILAGIINLCIPSAISSYNYKPSYACPACKTINSLSVTECIECGERLYSTKPTATQIVSQSITEVKWQCKSCSQLNSKHNTFCTGCGKEK